MEVTYVIETSPNGSLTDSVENDAHQTVAYHYDLELDANNEILGGEWYQSRHPDFVWAPSENSVSINNEDFSIKNDNDVVTLAPIASNANVPLKYVLDSIMKEFDPL
jgi:glyoxylate utilization-related uncharacterized protein